MMELLWPLPGFLLYLASEILDNVEDKELTTDQFLTSPEVASNLATGLIFSSFHTLTSHSRCRKSEPNYQDFLCLWF